MSDIDGRFSINVTKYPADLMFTFVGYKRKSIILTEAPSSPLHIQLSQAPLNLREFEVKAGENPAHRIIRQTWKNREKHDPLEKESFRCKTYSKMVMAGHRDTNWVAASEEAAKSNQSTDSFFTRQHLFMMESYSRRIFKNGKSREIVEASRVSGMKEASFLLLAMQLQPFSFYQPLIEVSSKNYLNPISRNSDEMYFFTLEDTLFSGRDSVYVISFRPRKNKVFNALEGVLYISAPDYAIQNVIATPGEGQESSVRIKIQQQYKRLDNGIWFPEQLNTDMDFLQVKLSGYNLKGEGRIYVTDAQLNVPVSNREFDEVVMEVESGSSEKSDAYWEEVRTFQLTEREKRTYEFIDSISKEANLERRIKLLESVFKGYIPIKGFDLDYARILAFNRHEGYRLGVGGFTNQRISDRYSLGGYYAYGFRDKKSKFRAEGKLNINFRNEVVFTASYTSDVKEAGGLSFYHDRRALTLETARTILVNLMDQQKFAEASLGFRWMKYIYTEAFSRQTHVRPLYAYQYTPDALPLYYTWLENGLSFRIAWKEQFYRNGRLRISLGTKAPIVRLQVTHGKDLRYGGSRDFVRAEIRAEKDFLWRRIGKSSIQVLGGIVDGDVPYSRLYNGRGNILKADRVKLAGYNSFETMEMNEFLSDRFAACFLRHDFGPMFKIKKWSPGLIFATNAMIGTLSDANNHKLIAFKIPDKGYYESGIHITNILVGATGGLGIAAFYRYGPYTDPNWKYNAAIKISLSSVF